MEKKIIRAQVELPVWQLVLLIVVIGICASMVLLLTIKIIGEKETPPVVPPIDTNHNIDENNPDENVFVTPLPPECGNNICEENETIYNCLADCFECNENATCEPAIGENSEMCPIDCTTPDTNTTTMTCGNLLCEFPENAMTCFDDCGICDNDDLCETQQGENENTCSNDCEMECQGTACIVCGNQVCEQTENTITCAVDCGCNNNDTCEQVRGENENNCANDCTTLSFSSKSFLIQEDKTMSLIFEFESNFNGNVTFNVVTPPSHGVLSPFIVDLNNRKASVRYTPNNNFRGNDVFTYNVKIGETTLSLTTVSLKVLPKLVPWVEINLPTTPVFDYYPNASGATAEMDGTDFAVAGLEHWAKVTDRVILTTSPGWAASFYPEVESRKPAGLKIFGGLKTSNILPKIGVPQNGVDNYDFTHLPSWIAIASEAQEIVNYTNNPVIVLENESALWNYHFGNHTINYSEFSNVLTQTLKPLADEGIVFWWWLPNYFTAIPAVNGASETTQFVNTIKSVLPNSIFMTQYSAYYWWNENNNNTRNGMINLVGLPGMIEAIWIDQDINAQFRFYTPAEAIAELEGTLVREGESTQPFQILTKEVELYPGGGEWIMTGQTFDDLLPDLASTDNNG